jgi:hypothetical protein
MDKYGVRMTSKWIGEVAVAMRRRDMSPPQQLEDIVTLLEQGALVDELRSPGDE